MKLLPLLLFFISCTHITMQVDRNIFVDELTVYEHERWIVMLPENTVVGEIEFSLHELAGWFSPHEFTEVCVSWHYNQNFVAISDPNRFLNNYCYRLVVEVEYKPNNHYDKEGPEKIIPE